MEFHGFKVGERVRARWRQEVYGTVVDPKSPYKWDDTSVPVRWDCFDYGDLSPYSRTRHSSILHLTPLEQAML